MDFKYHVPGTHRLAEATAKALQSNDVVAWIRHGVVSVGQNVDSAFGKIETVDKLAGKYLYFLFSEQEPSLISKKDVMATAQQFKIDPKRLEWMFTEAG